MAAEDAGNVRVPRSISKTKGMKHVSVRRGTAEDLPSLQTVNLAAFKPIHESFAEILGPGINSLVYPDWRRSQQHELVELVDKPNVTLFVAESDSQLVGFVVVEINEETRVGELCMIAVRPDARGQGIGGMLNERALQVMRDAGMKLAELGTGGDSAHAAARRSYERVGYTALPLVRYYKAL
jgi:ribosomal protein S18 acetylase RimI-like enzyme